MPRLQNGPGLDPNGLYRAVELVGRDCYSLTLIEPAAASPEAPEYVVKIDAGLCRRLRSRARPGETLREQIERVLLATL